MLDCIQCIFKVDYPPFLRIYLNIAHCMHTNPFNQRNLRYVSRYLAYPSGGLKGKMAPTAMPTLAVGAFLVIKNTTILTNMHKYASVKLQRDCLVAVASALRYGAYSQFEREVHILWV